MPVTDYDRVNDPRHLAPDLAKPSFQPGAFGARLILETLAQEARAPKRVVSGLIKCGSCGGGMSSNGSDRKGVRIQCSNCKESGSCSNGRRI